MNIGEYISHLRTKIGLSQRKLAELSGISNTEISRIESGERQKVYPDTLKSIAPHLGVTAEDLMSVAGIIDTSHLMLFDKHQNLLFENPEEYNNDHEFEFDNYKNYLLLHHCNLVKIPLLGPIRAGNPIEASENPESYIWTDKSFISSTREYFYLTIIGDSMDREFKDGSLVLVQKQDFLSNGEIGVVLIDGLDATVKKVVIDENLITLIPCSNNPEHLPKSYNMKQEKIQILGKVILAMKKYL